ncbi:MAG: hypothetical protein JNL71_16130 [Rhodospirillales bacterium]|nr:hypothetical protein [Rhodospirillales bacterium]
MATALFFARDPGPTNQIAAAWHLCGEAGPLVPEGAEKFRADLAPFAAERLALARGPAVAALARAGIASESVADAFGAPGPRAAREAAAVSFLRARGVGVVVTGTSDVDEDLDRILWAAARSAGIESHVFLDHPANLAARFRDAGGELLLPDKLYAPDEGYRAALAAASVDFPDLRIVGPIHENRLAAGRTAAFAARGKLRALWGATDCDHVVLFASECGREMEAVGRKAPYDEIVELTKYTENLARSGAGTRTILVVRPHPRDAAGKYDAWSKAAPAMLRCVVSAAGAPAEAILAADLVVGMDSTMLREARVLGRAHLSVVGATLAL